MAPGAFVDAGGKAIEGDVELSYKSMNSVAEIVASGIPMSAVYNDKVEQFISDGMFEITASYNNAAVKIAEGKEIKVFTPSRDKISDFKYWFFNKENTLLEVFSPR